MDKKKTEKTKDKNEKRNVVPAEDRFISVRKKKKTSSKKNKSANSKKTEKEAIARFLADDDIFEAEEIKIKASNKKASNNKNSNKKTTNKKTSDSKAKNKSVKKKKKKKKKINPKAFWIIVAVIVFVIMFIFLFRVRSIEVKGNINKSAEDIVALSGIKKGEHLWFFGAREAKEKLVQDPYIYDVTIKRSYPSTVVIIVAERNATALIQSVSAHAVIDENGYVISIDDASHYDNLLSVTGMGAAGYKVGTYLGDENDFMARTLLSILDAMEASGMKDEIKALDISNPMSIEMQTKSGVNVHMGQSDNAEEKLEKLRVVLPWLKENGYTEGTVDISVQGDAVYSPPSTPTPIPTLTPTPKPTPTLKPESEPTSEPSGDAE